MILFDIISKTCWLSNTVFSYARFSSSSLRYLLLGSDWTVFEKRSKHSSISIHSWVPICTLILHQTRTELKQNWPFCCVMENTSLQKRNYLHAHIVPTLYIQVQGKSIKLNFCHELSFIWLQCAIHRNQFVIKALQQIQYQPVKEEK